MSELIDRIFDAEKISAEINEILKGLGDVKAELSGFSDAYKTTMSEIRKAKGTDELAESSKKLNDQFASGQKAMKTWQDEVAKLNEKTKKLTETEKQGSIEIAKARLELQAAQKATKEAALAEIELAAANGKLSTSYNALQKDLTNSIKAYKALEEEERNSAKGQELLSKIQATQKTLKETDAPMGNYQRNVGNYASAIEGLTPSLGGLAGTLLDIAKAAKQNKKDMDDMSNSTNLGITSMGKAPAGLSTLISGFKGLGQVVVSVGKAFLANPIGIVLGGLVLIFKQVSNAINESEERSNKFNEIMARLAPIGRTIGDIFEFVADIVLDFASGVSKAYSAVMEFLGINPKGSADAFVNAEKMKQKAAAETRRLNEDAAKQEQIIAEQRAILSDKENYNYSQRKQALKIAGEAEQKLANDRKRIAELNYKAIKAEADLDDQNAEMKNKVSQAYIAMNNAAKESAGVRRKLGKEAQKLNAENQADLKAEAEAAKAAMDKIIAARRRLVDSQFAIQKDSQEKSISMANENYKRQIQDLERNGELTKELRKNIETANQNEVQKIKKEWALKNLNESIKTDEMILENMKKAGQNTLEFEKQILKDRMKAEIMAGGNEFAIKQKYKFLEIDLIAKTNEEKAALFQKEINKRAELMKIGFDKEASELKKRFANGKISREQYEKDLAEIQLKATTEINEANIKAIEELLNNSEMSADKRAELSNALAKLRIENENAVTDAVIKNNDEQLKSDEEKKKKQVKLIEEIANLTNEVFGAIAEYERNRSEEKLSELEKEQEAADKAFEHQQEMLDNGIMSDETRAEKQKEINEKKAAADKEIQDKIKAEKIKQAKWEKAQAIVSALINTALAVTKAVLESPLTFGLPWSAFAAASGAIQIATIAAQPIQAYAEGTDNHPGGLSLWGEERPEVAVTPSGEIFIAEKPTLTDFDAGTKIYKSVSEFENFMNSSKSKSFEFDYDKMANKMPQQNIVLDSRGLWGIVNKQNSRRTLINRRYLS